MEKVQIKSKYFGFFGYIIFNIFVFSRCQLLSCTTEKGSKKKNRKNPLRAFPTQWSQLSKEHREEIRRSLRKFILQNKNYQLNFSSFVI